MRAQFSKVDSLPMNTLDSVCELNPHVFVCLCLSPADAEFANGVHQRVCYTLHTRKCCSPNMELRRLLRARKKKHKDSSSISI